MIWTFQQVCYTGSTPNLMAQSSARNWIISEKLYYENSSVWLQWKQNKKKPLLDLKEIIQHFSSTILSSYMAYIFTNLFGYKNVIHVFPLFLFSDVNAHVCLLAVFTLITVVAWIILNNMIPFIMPIMIN